MQAAASGDLKIEDFPSLSRERNGLSTLLQLSINTSETRAALRSQPNEIFRILKLHLQALACQRACWSAFFVFNDASNFLLSPLGERLVVCARRNLRVAGPVIFRVSSQRFFGLDLYSHQNQVKPASERTLQNQSLLTSSRSSMPSCGASNLGKFALI